MTMPLTDRQHEVLIEVARGSTAAGVAEALGIAHHTVKGHLKNVKSALGTNSTTHAVAVAMAHGWITAEDIAPFPTGGTR